MDSLFFDAITKMEEELRLRNYSPKTVKSYLRCVREFGMWAKELSPLSANHIRNFILEKIKRGLAPQTIHMYMNALKFLFRNIFDRHDMVQIKTLRRTKRLPVVLSREEVHRLIDTITNARHKLMLTLAYGGGLRVSELVRLKVRDLDLQQGLVCVREGKGRKDRMTLLPRKCIEELSNMAAGKSAEEWLFVSNRSGHLTTRSAQKAFENALKKAEIQKAATFHSLRHSFATHLLENGVNLRYIQELLGHKNIKTTCLYTRVTTQYLSEIPSPW